MGKLAHKGMRLFVIMGIIGLISGLFRQTVSARIGDEQFFAETGHSVTGEFLDAFHGVKNPQFFYGFPITDAMEDPNSHQIVQYFEKTRFELDPDNSEGIYVRRTPLGDYLYQSNVIQKTAIKTANCQKIPYNPYKICDAFLDFFLKHGKETQFGFPRSNLEIHDGWIVQYFDLARLEWHPENPPQERVMISNLGLKYFYETRQNPDALLPKAMNSLQPVIEIEARAFPETAVVPRQGEQAIYVIVQDQILKPVPGVKVNLDIQLPSGEIISMKTTLTDENGIVKFPFSYQSESIGEAIIQGTAQYGKFKRTFFSAFRIW